jgi:hypothetical protein
VLRDKSQREWDEYGAKYFFITNTFCKRCKVSQKNHLFHPNTWIINCDGKDP